MDYKKKFEKEAHSQLVGKKVVAVRYLSKEEVKQIGWYHSCLVVIFEDGTMIYPSKDDEGNDAGTLFGQSKTGKSLTYPKFPPY